MCALRNRKREKRFAAFQGSSATSSCTPEPADPCPSRQYSVSSTAEGSMKRERLQRITIEAGKCGGRPCIRGLRIRVTDILELLGAGASFDEILSDYPFLEREDILAALDYAAYQTDHAVLQSS